MNINIFDKIFKIMTEYENLLNYINHKSNVNKNDNINNDNYMNKDDIINNNCDTFFNYIYNNIKIIPNKININNNLDNELLIKKNKLGNNNIQKDKLENENIQKDELENENIQKDELENENIQKDELENENKLIIDKFIKKIYKKIILKCHPDKNGDNNLFIKCQEYYEKKFLIGLIYISYIIKYSIPFIDNIIINQILIEIRIIQHNIDLLKEKYIIK